MANGALKRTPLFDCHVRAGGKLVPFVGWELPIQYSGIVAEHLAVRQQAGLFDVSHMGEIEIRGAGAEAFLQRLTTNDVGRLEVGQAQYSALLTERGTFIDDLVLYRLEADRFLAVVNAGPLADDWSWLKQRAPATGVTLADRSEATALLALQGPRAAAILAPLVDVELASLSYYRFCEATLGDQPVLLSRTGYTGEDGFEIYMTPAAAPSLWSLLLEHGGAAGVVPVGLGARDSLRLEAGLLLSGQDFDRETTPYEVGLGWTVKLAKGSFVGREALVAERENGSRRQLIAFELKDRGIARPGCSVLVESRAAGRVTSGGWSPTLGRAIGLALVDSPEPAVGGELGIDVRGRELAATVVKRPFYRRAD